MRARLALMQSLVVVASVAAGPRIIDFDRDRAGGLPSRWEAATTKAGSAAQWRILEDQTAPSRPNVLAQVSTDPIAGRFPLTVLRDVTIRDGELSVRFKPVSGEVDQAA